jgi:hypothetical protein
MDLILLLAFGLVIVLALSRREPPMMPPNPMGHFYPNQYDYNYMYFLARQRRQRESFMVTLIFIGVIVLALIANK